MGIISLDDYEKIDHVLLEKYKLSLSSLYRDIVLINKENRGNMPYLELSKTPTPKGDRREDRPKTTKEA